MMNDDMSRKQKLIDEQNTLIKQLKDKIEHLEQQHTDSRLDLEKRLNEKEYDLQTKIATFEANLHEGRHYFEDTLREKETIIKEKTLELNQLKQRLNDSLEDSSNQLDLTAEITESNNKTDTNLQKFDAENLKNIKSLYEHQIELLKVKIEMLEKTCQNYQKGIKDMNKSFGQQQQTDEMTSIQSFKELMQHMHKANAQLETERIDLQVKVSKLKEDLEQTRIEKENLNRKFVNTDQLNQKLQSERNEVELNYRRQIDLKHNELIHLNSELNNEKTDNEKLKLENESLNQQLTDYEQLKLNHTQLTQHYEQLYNQASEIVTGNQLLNEQVQQNVVQIQQLNQLVEDYQLKIDHLEHCNSELNTQKINLDMKLASSENKIADFESDLKELNHLRNSKLNIEKLNQLNKDIELELLEKNELIDQLNQAKDFLAENNSKLLTNNIRIQLFVESMGLELSSLDSNASVKEYDSLRTEFKEAQFQLNEIKIFNKQLEINQQNFKDSINLKELEIKNLLNQLNDLKSVVKLDQSEQCDLTDYQTNFTEIQTENLSLNIQLEETKRELNDLKQKYEKNTTNEQANNDLITELNAVKLKYEETVQKQTNLEQLNLKLKAKLKYVLKQQQQTVADNQTVSNETQTEPIQIQVVEALNVESLIQFGSKIATSDLHDHVARRVDELKNSMNLFLLNNEVKIQTANKEILQLKSKVKQLEIEQTHSQIEPLSDSISLINVLKQKESELNSLNERLNTKTSELEQAILDQSQIIANNERLKLELSDLKQKESNLLDEIQQAKTKYDNLRLKTVALKDKLKKSDDTNNDQKHKDEIDQLNKIYSEQLKQFEINFTNIQNENEDLNNQLEESKLEINELNQQCRQTFKKTAEISLQTDNSLIEKYETDLKSLQAANQLLNIQLEQAKLDLNGQMLKNETPTDEFKLKYEELLLKQTNIEQMNLKLKAKLKQVLKQQQSQQSASLLIEQRSTCSTPTLSPHSNYDSQTDTISTQTDQLDIDSLEQLLSSYKAELQIMNTQLDDSNTEVVRLKENIKETEFINQQAVAHYQLQISQLEQQTVKIEQTLPVQSINDEELKNLNAKLDSVQQQNLKLKAKLKQVLEKNKNTNSDDKFRDEVEHLKQVNVSLNNELNDLRQKLDTLKARLADLEAEKQGLNLQCNQLAQNYSSQIESLQEEIVEKNSNILQLNEDLNQIKLQLPNDQSQSLRVQHLEQLVQDYDLKLNSNLNELKQLNENQLILNQEKDAKLLDLSNQLFKVNELEQLVQDYQLKCDHLNSTLNELKQFNSNNQNDLINENKYLKSSYNVLNEQYQLTLNKIQDLEQSIDHLNSQLNDLKQQNEIENTVLLQENQLLNNQLQANSVQLEQLDQQSKEYQSNTNHLNQELNDLKQQKQNLINENKEKHVKLLELNTELNDLKTKIQEEFDHSFSNGHSVNHSSNNSICSTVSNKSGQQLEAQLKFCHKKCETVVEKLNLLKKQNETLNSKIKSFKSMI